MAILPPCRDHEERIQSLEQLMEGVVSTLAAIVAALKDSNTNIAGLQDLQTIKDTLYTPGEMDPDHTYFR
jgi:hypothetical protein